MLRTEHMQKLWPRMARIYGHKWLSGFGEADDGTWLSGLQDLMPCEIAAGLRRCIRRGDAWPPSLPEFRSLCLGLESEAMAVEAAMQGQSLGPVSFQLRRLINSWDQEHSTELVLRKRYTALYEQALEVAMNIHMAMDDDERKLLAEMGANAEGQNSLDELPSETLAALN